MKLLEGKLTLNEEQVELKPLEETKYSIKYWYDEDARDLGEPDDYDETFDNLVDAKKQADRLFDKEGYASVEIYDENDKVVYGRYPEEYEESLKEAKKSIKEAIKVEHPDDYDFNDVVKIFYDQYYKTYKHSPKDEVKEFKKFVDFLIKSGLLDKDVVKSWGEIKLESLKEANDDDKKDDKKKDDKKSSKKDDKKEDEEDIDIEDEVDIDVEDDKDLPDVDVDDMLSLDDLDIDAENDLDIDIDANNEEDVPEEIVTNAKAMSISDIVRNEFDSIDALKGVIATLTLTNDDINEDDEKVIDILNEIVDLKLETVGMLNKALEITDGDLVDSMLDGADKAEEIIADTDDEITIEDDIEDVFGAGQDLEVSDNFDVERDNKEKGLFDLDDIDALPDEEEDNEIIIKDKKTK